MINKQILAQIHANLSFIYCHFATFLNAKLKEKWPNDNKYNSVLCVFVPKFAYLSQQYNETLIIIICNSKNLIE